MTIEKLDSKRVLISLKAEDMSTYAISVDRLNLSDACSKQVLKSIMGTACESVGISIENKAALVEVLPHNEGLFIMITVDELNKLRKVYKIKRPKLQPCCKFSDAESLISCVEHLNATGAGMYANSLWLYKNAYYLVFDFSVVSAKARTVLSEYALCISMSTVRIARLKEAGKMIIGKNAVSKIAKAFCTKP